MFVAKFYTEVDWFVFLVPLQIALLNDYIKNPTHPPFQKRVDALNTIKLLLNAEKKLIEKDLMENEAAIESSKKQTQSLQDLDNFNIA